MRFVFRSVSCKWNHYVIFVPDFFNYTVCEICCLSLLLLSSVPLYGYMQFFNPFTCWWLFGLFIVFGSFQGLQTKWPSTCFCKKKFVLLESSYAQSFHVVCSCFEATVAEMSSYDRPTTWPSKPSLLLADI